MRHNQKDLEIEGTILEISATQNATVYPQLYQDTSDELRRLLVRKMGDEVEADEIAQYAFVRLRHLRHNRDVDNLRSYLFNMAVRLVINMLR